MIKDNTTQRAKVEMRAFLTECKKISDARLVNQITHEEVTMRVPVPEELKQIVAKLNLPH
jgi:hypothetical protein